MPDKIEASLCYPYGSRILSGSIKKQPEDFIVTEQLGFNPVGEGEHLFLNVEKRLLTTHDLMDQLARVVGISSRQVSHSGLKDKQAITRQWISLHLPGCKQIPEIPDTENYRILRSEWHCRKLRVGTHQANSFEVIIRDIKGQSENLDDVVNNINSYGFANYFGEQRFGQKQDNVEQALRVLNHAHKLKRLTRSKKSLYLSALRSELFNQVLNERIKQGIWKKPLDGDVYVLSGSQSIFHEPLDQEIANRYQSFDLNCGIALYGSGIAMHDSDAKALEAMIFENNPDILQTLDDNQLKLSYRPNRAVAQNLQIELLDDNQLVIKVTLSKGSYVTALVNHILEIH